MSPSFELTPVKKPMVSRSSRRPQNTDWDRYCVGNRHSPRDKQAK
jgi:hypothetical protein